jgi:hypothetical protein
VEALKIVYHNKKGSQGREPSQSGEWRGKILFFGVY